MEHKLAKLTDVYNTIHISGTVLVEEEPETKYSIASSFNCGDVCVANKEIKEFSLQVLSNSCLKFDNNANFAGRRLSIMKNDNKKLIEKIDASNKALNLLKTSKNNVKII